MLGNPKPSRGLEILQKIPRRILPQFPIPKIIEFLIELLVVNWYWEFHWKG